MKISGTIFLLLRSNNNENKSFTPFLSEAKGKDIINDSELHLLPTWPRVAPKVQGQEGKKC
jgi:hypothetical protein